jgi:multicomponent Na+:H+ antiporter subunit G
MMSMTSAQILATLLIFAGCTLSLLASFGLLRMPDSYMRMQSGTKAATLGVACFAGGTALIFGDGRVLVECVVLILFVFLTGPVASHMIARASWGQGIAPWLPSASRRGQTQTQTPPDRSRGSSGGSSGGS